MNIPYFLRHIWYAINDEDHCPSCLGVLLHQVTRQTVSLSVQIKKGTENDVVLSWFSFNRNVHYICDTQESREFNFVRTTTTIQSEDTTRHLGDEHPRERFSAPIRRN